MKENSQSHKTEVSRKVIFSYFHISFQIKQLTHLQHPIEIGDIANFKITYFACTKVFVFQEDFHWFKLVIISFLILLHQISQMFSSNYITEPLMGSYSLENIILTFGCCTGPIKLSTFLYKCHIKRDHQSGRRADVNQ